MQQKSTRLPAYQQIAELIYREIAAGHWRPGDRLPPESELSKTLQVAVGTLRKALAKLAEDGWIERRQGSGNYIKKQPDGKAIYHFFHLELPDGGGMPHAEVLDIASVKDPSIGRLLGCDSQWRIARKRFLNQSLVAIEQIYIDKRHTSELLQGELHESLYLHYKDQFDFWIARVEDRISYEKAPSDVCRLLGYQNQTVLGKVSRTAWSQKGKIEEFSVTWFDANKCQYIAGWP